MHAFLQRVHQCAQSAGLGRAHACRRYPRIVPLPCCTSHQLYMRIAAGSGAATVLYLYMLACLFLVFALLAAVLLQQHHDYVCRSCHIVRSGLVRCCVSIFKHECCFNRSDLLAARATQPPSLSSRIDQTSALYAKAMRLTPTARAELGTGAITTIMSVDAQRIGEALLFLHNMYAVLCVARPRQVHSNLARLPAGRVRFRFFCRSRFCSILLAPRRWAAPRWRGWCVPICCMIEFHMFAPLSSHHASSCAGRCSVRRLC